VFSIESTNDITAASPSYSLVPTTTSNSAGDTSNGTGAITPALLDEVHAVFGNANYAVINVASGSGTISPVIGAAVKIL
jgi:hypothetical protein